MKDGVKEKERELVKDGAKEKDRELVPEWERLNGNMACLAAHQMVETVRTF